jgi:signal peptidase I
MAKTTKAEPRYGVQSASRTAPPAASSRAAVLRGYVQSFGLAILLALVFRQFVIQAFRIPSASMEDTLLIGDFLFVNKFLYGAQFPFSDTRLPAIRLPRRGDIIVFRPPGVNTDYIKRCVAVAGDTIEVRAKQLFINGVAQQEPYTKHTRPLEPPGAGPRDYFGPHVVPHGHIFMMGDNRDNSNDSRYWLDEPLSRIKGKAMFIYFSVDTPRGYFPPHLRLRRIGRIIH